MSRGMSGVGGVQTAMAWGASDGGEGPWVVVLERHGGLTLRVRAYDRASALRAAGVRSDDRVLSCLPATLGLFDAPAGR